MLPSSSPRIDVVRLGKALVPLADAGPALANDVLVQPFAGAEPEDIGAGASIEIDEPIYPIPKLAEAAAAISPFPLPKIPARVDRFWTFYGLVGTPTVPGVVLQLAARDIASSRRFAREASAISPCCARSR